MSAQIPQGIEVLVLKAAVDPDFKRLLLQERSAAAAAIGLELTAAEATMLAAVPAAQLEAIAARAAVPQEHRRAFLGQAAAAMLAALGTIRLAVAEEPAHPQPAGIPPGRPPMPPKKEKTVEERVIDVISKRSGVEAKDIKRNDTLVKDLKVKPADLVELRKDLEKEFDIEISTPDFKKVRFVANAITCVQKALKSKKTPSAPPPASAGIQPDSPPFGCGGMWAPRPSN
jgi:acyl carrier protein